VGMRSSGQDASRRLHEKHLPPLLGSGYARTSCSENPLPVIYLNPFLLTPPTLLALKRWYVHPGIVTPICRTASIRSTHFGHFFQPLPCPLSFHVSIIRGISNMASLRLSNRAFIVLSEALPFTRSPTPVPFTLSPFSALLRSLSSMPLTVCGSNSSTPCWRASFTSSACLRKEKTGSCHFRVTACFRALNGLSAPVAVAFEAICCAATAPSNNVFEDGSVEVGWLELGAERRAGGG